MPKRITATPSVESLVASSSELVSLPEIYTRIKQLVDDPESSLAELAKIIELDPGLSARVLRVANSAALGLARQVDSPAHAVAMLGMQQVHDLALATTVIRSFNAIPQTLFEMRRFWLDSLACGARTKLMGDQHDVLDSERLFLVGLIAQLGKLVMACEAPAACRETLEWAQANACPLTRAQAHLLGFDQAELTGLMLREWHLPEALIEPVMWYTRPSATRHTTLPTGLLHLSALLAEAAGRNVEPASWLADFADREAVAALDLDVNQAIMLEADTQEFVASVARMFEVGAP